MSKNKTKSIPLISFLLALITLLGACQTTPVSPTTPSHTETVSTTEIPTVSPSPSPTATPLPTATNTATPTPPPAAFWQMGLPETFVSEIVLPDGSSWQSDSTLSRYHIIPFDKKQKLEPLAQTDWTYVLVAPFFTVTDNLSYEDLRAFLAGNDMPDGAQEDTKVLMTQSDKAAILHLLNMSWAQNIKTVMELDDISADAWGQDWAIVPFEALEPQWKVIAVDGVSPLDHDFDPEVYKLNLRVGVFHNEQDNWENPENEFDFSTVLPSPNRDRSQLTSLIMTGVTAMARDTAFIMETEGVLYPGEKIRDLLRVADLTHISNEVSFYEDCPYPDPDYEGFIFCSNPEYIKLLDDLSADIIELTGNHNNDVLALYKVDSVPFTLDLYEQYEMQWYAGGVNERDAKSPLHIEHNGNRLAFIGCNSYGPTMAWALDERSGAAPCEDFGWLKSEVADLRQKGYLPIVTFQFQEDYVREATSLQERDFRDVAQAGPVIVNGSQSHVAKAMEFYEGSFIHYGLGNLFFEQPDVYITYDSFIQEHYFYQGRLINTRLHTITIRDGGQPRLMTEEERQKFLTMIFDVSEPLRRTQ